MALVPAPPAMGSDAFALDEAVARAAATTRGSARWTLAIDDANLAFPRAAGVFECALDAPVSAQDTPRLYVLLRRALADAGLSTYAAKDHYRRARPFMVNQLPTCTLAEETMLREDGSYPSGHNAIGWAWALILAEIAPDRADLVLARGRAFGQSRVICNVHWQSDASEGRTMGAAAVARMHADRDFRADLIAARAELASVRARALRPTRGCRAEPQRWRRPEARAQPVLREGLASSALTAARSSSPEKGFRSTRVTFSWRAEASSVASSLAVIRMTGTGSFAPSSRACTSNPLIRGMWMSTIAHWGNRVASDVMKSSPPENAAT
jgi:acid phosphatase (class A)